MSLRFLSVATIALLAVPLMAQSAKGIKPRSKPESYPAVNEQPTVILGAAQLSPTQIRKTFVSSLGEDYLVFEIGAFPKSAIPLSPQDFMLVVRGGKDVVRPADPDVITGTKGRGQPRCWDFACRWRRLFHWWRSQRSLYRSKRLDDNYRSVGTWWSSETGSQDHPSRSQDHGGRTEGKAVTDWNHCP